MKASTTSYSFFTTLESWHKHSLLIDYLKNSFKFFELEHAITVLVVFHNHFVHFLSTDLFAELLHSQANVLFSNGTRGVCIKRIEDSHEARLSHELTRINRCCKELTVVNLLIVVIVHLIDHFANLCIAHIHSLLNKDIMEFLSFDHASTICVDSLKLRSKIFNFLLSGCLNKKVHGSFLEGTHAFKVTESVDDLVTNFLPIISCTFCLFCGSGGGMNFEPWVVKGFLTTQSFLLIYNQKFPNQIFTLVGNIVEFIVVEMVVSLLDLAENIGSTRTLKWQITANQGIKENTKRPYVCFRTVGSLEDFRCHVVWSASYSGEIFFGIT